jgi:hypothetical protein
MQDDFMTGDDVAALVHVTPGALANMRYRGDGPRGYKVGKRILYRRDDVERWLETRREPELQQQRAVPARR